MKILLARFIAKKIANRIKKSATAAAAGSVVGIGGLAWYKPELLELIPEQYRGYAIIAVGIVVLLARVRTEIAEGIREAKEAAGE